MYEVNLTLQETASDMDSLNNSLGKIKSGNKKLLFGTGPVPQEHTFMPVC